MNLKQIFRVPIQWYIKTPERSLDRAYRSALKIKDIEDKHFNGQKVSNTFSNYGESVINYFKSEVQGHLQTIRVGLTEFKTSNLLLNLLGLSDFAVNSQYNTSEPYPTNSSALFLEKLNFIDSVVSKYQNNDVRENEAEKRSIIKKQKELNALEAAPSQPETKLKSRNKSFLEVGYIDDDVNGDNKKLQMATNKTGVIPRSFLNTLNRIKQEIDPKSEETEEAVLKKFRSSRYKTAISIKFILLLIIVPLLTHQLTKTFLIAPLVEKYFSNQPQFVFINQDFEDEAFAKLKRFEESLQFRKLIGLAPDLTPEKIDTEIQIKAEEIKQEFRRFGTGAIANIFADFFSLIAFGVVIASSRREIEIVKSFLDNILYNLSDSAKAFLIILFTDMFVGFHSPHGWEVVLEGMARHFGLPENRDFNFLFIATFPVILDTVLKYWIFRYLNRISPSAVATYRNMNE